MKKNDSSADKIPSNDEIFRNYCEKVRAYILKRGVFGMDAEDLTNEIFAKVFAKIGTFSTKRGASLSTWIYIITQRTLIDFFRTHKQSVEIGTETADPQESIEAKTEREIDKDDINAALQRLDERSRKLLLLHFYERLTLKDAAAKLQMSYSNAKIVMKKAIAKLRGCIN